MVDKLFDDDDDDEPAAAAPKAATQGRRAVPVAPAVIKSPAAKSPGGASEAYGDDSDFEDDFEEDVDD